MRLMRKTCLLKFSTNIPFPITCIYFLCVREAFIKYYSKNSLKSREEGEEAIDEEICFFKIHLIYLQMWPLLEEMSTFCNWMRRN